MKSLSKYRGTGRTTRLLREAIKFANEHKDFRAIYVIAHRGEKDHTEFLLRKETLNGRIENLQIRVIEQDMRYAIAGLKCRIFIDHDVWRRTKDDWLPRVINELIILSDRNTNSLA